MTKIKRFTLIEVIVSMTVWVTVSVLIAGATAAFMRAYESSNYMALCLTRSQTLSRVADRCLRNAVVFVWNNEDENDEEQLVFKGEASELWTSAQSRDYGGSGGFIFSRLYLKNNTLYCDYSFRPLLPWLELDQQTYRTEKIADNVAALAFRYYNRDSNDELVNVDTWDEDYTTTIPLAIQMEVTFTDGTVERRLRRTAGSSWNSSLGTREDSLE
ncbi:MAG: hypothetical protein AB7F40_06945 [Victivallaceae bacterium]|nr:hypothetical protein [Victivallaceae bacterium]